MMAVIPTLIFHGCMGFSPLEFDRTFVSTASSTTRSALLLAEGTGHPRRGPSVASMHGKPGGGFRADALGAVVLGRNLDIDPPGAPLAVGVLELRVRVLDPAILDGQT